MSGENFDIFEIRMPTQLEKAKTFRALHEAPGIFVIPNPWDAGSSRILTALGFKALATTSAGHAHAMGRLDGVGAVSREEALANAKAICDATHLPVNGDLENLYAHAPDAAAATVPLAAAAGLVGCSIEDATCEDGNPIYDLETSIARVKAAVAAARALPFPFTLTARAENFLHGRKDIDDTIRRLQAYEAAGADVLYAPGLNDIALVRQVMAAVTKPVNVIVSNASAHFTVAELGAAGVKRISVGSALARTALGGFLTAAREIAEQGTFIYGKTTPTMAQIESLIEGKTA